MCGIVGIVHRDGRPVDASVLRAMTGQLVHRGPDDEGHWVGPGGVGFGHRRLSIIDLAGSIQPMQAGPLHVCFNGEIFNYQSLRSEAAGRGYPFRTHGDTEVLLALFQAERERSVDRLEGQFAYAIWDADERVLWLFRDRMGVLPLYYHWDGETLTFASEIKALLAGLAKTPAIDAASVDDYLGYRSVPAPFTLWEGVRKLPPGCRLRFDGKSEPRIEAYWTLPTAPASLAVSPVEAIDRVEAALRDSISNRLVADVPVGAYLSGGVDSSLVVAMMTRLTGGSGVETFSAGFDDPRFDELPFAREVSRLFATRHHEIVVQPTDFQDLWHRLTWHRDAPISEPADLAIFCLARRARESSIKVLLSGEGSDELFAGYPKYGWARRAALADWIPSALRPAGLGLVERMLPARAARPRIMLRAMATRSEADRFQAWFAPFTLEERAALSPGTRGRGGHEAIWSRARGDLVQRMLYFDCHTWLVDNLLERGDRMAMAASIESRPPFMDHRLVELAFALPSSVKIRDGHSKWVVKEVARRHLPASIVDRRKVGFRVPLDAWFRTGLRELANDLLLRSGSFVGDQLARAPIARLLSDHERGRRDEEIRIWTLLCLEIWHQVFFRDQRGFSR